jgi:hypothetical protein
MPSHAQIFSYEEDDDAFHLAALGLASDDLRGALTGGYTLASSLTANHPRLAHHFNIWSETIASLRDAKAAAKWINCSDRNYETVRHPDGLCQVAVASGTHETGLRGGTGPQTSSKKGAATREVVERNQLTLFPNPSHTSSTSKGVKPPTWLLLHTYDFDEQQIRCELSLPTDMNDDVITSWSTRIILEPIPFEMPRGDRFDDDPDDQIDIDVPRRPD